MKCFSNICEAVPHTPYKENPEDDDDDDVSYDDYEHDDDDDDDNGDDYDEYVIFVILLTPAPFSTDIKNTLIPDFLTPKIHKIHDFHTKTH